MSDFFATAFPEEVSESTPFNFGLPLFVTTTECSTDGSMRPFFVRNYSIPPGRPLPDQDLHSS